MGVAEELRIAVVCSSNMNRSMEAHAFLAKKGYNVESYGTGDKVKLPGPTPDKPNVYEFGVAHYDYIYQDLSNKDRHMYGMGGQEETPNSVKTKCQFHLRINKVDAFLCRYTQNGLLHMLDRNRRIKAKPERFQASEKQFDLIITCEERVYDQLVERTSPFVS